MGLADPAVDSETGVAHDPDDGRRHVEQPWIRVGVDADPVDGRVTEPHGNPCDAVGRDGSQSTAGRVLNRL